MFPLHIVYRHSAWYSVTKLKLIDKSDTGVSNLYNGVVLLMNLVFV